MFPRHTRSYETDPVKQSPFARAAQVWDDRIGSARVQARNWRVMAFASFGLAGALAGGLIYQSTQTRVEAYVVEIDPSGRPGQIQLLGERYEPTAAQVAFHVSELVRKTRSKPLDPVVLKQNWDAAYRFLAGDAVVAMNEYASRADPFAAAKRDTAVAVEVVSVVQRSDGSFQVRWKETTYERGSQTATSDWTGLFTTKVISPRTSQTVFHNPLGVYVTNFNWTEEMAGER